MAVGTFSDARVDVVILGEDTYMRGKRLPSQPPQIHVSKMSPLTRICMKTCAVAPPVKRKERDFCDLSARATDWLNVARAGLSYGGAGDLRYAAVLK
jgi:hypothetical protein